LKVDEVAVGVAKEGRGGPTVSFECDGPGTSAVVGFGFHVVDGPNASVRVTPLKPFKMPGLAGVSVIFSFVVLADRRQGRPGGTGAKICN